MNNFDSYKIIYFLENMLREYIDKYIEKKDVNGEIVNGADNRALENGINIEDKEYNYLFWLHLGELIDIIKSRKFKRIKSNNVSNINISSLIDVRNDIMHTRFLDDEKVENLKQKSFKLIEALSEAQLTDKWNKFITQDIEAYTLPNVYIEYPLGRDFKSLIGRDEELRLIKEQIQIPSPLTIVGNGGIGKTALIQKLIEDFMFLPARRFDNIYFMSFKDSVFENGKINRFQKVISNHEDLILKLAECMDIVERDFQTKEKLVWEKMFNTNSILILDNLETEIVRSNLSEFTEIADKFIKNYTSSSRLIITSRFGLGDRERKFPLKKFDLERTKALIESKLDSEQIKNLKVSKEDWQWIQEYTDGNPGLAIVFANLIKSSNKTINDLKVDYKNKYSEYGKELDNVRESFLDFCFENTIESINKNSQLYLSIISYFCITTGIYQLSHGILHYVCSELKLDKRLGSENIRTIMLENIGFIQKKGLESYVVNELQVNFLNRNNEHIQGVEKLKELEWHNEIENIINIIIDQVYDEDLTTEQLLARIYKMKFDESQNNDYLLNAFMMEPSIKRLIDYYSKISEEEVLNHFTLLEKCKSELKNHSKEYEQQKLLNIIIRALNGVREKIKTRTITKIRQSDLMGYFGKLSDSVYILQSKNLNIRNRKEICKFLNSISKEDEAEKYLIDSEEMYVTAFVVYSRKFGNLVGANRDQCELYKKKCEELIGKITLSVPMECKHKINLARYYKNTNPDIAIKNASYFDNLRINDNFRLNNKSIYSNYLESRLIIAECSLELGKDNSVVNKALEEFKKEKEEKRYNELYPAKKDGLQRQFINIENKIQRKGKYRNKRR